jgi:ribosomal protein S12 methylthiotransferase accessory factor
MTQLTIRSMTPESDSVTFESRKDPGSLFELLINQSRKRGSEIDLKTILHVHSLIDFLNGERSASLDLSQHQYKSGDKVYMEVMVVHWHNHVAFYGHDSKSICSSCLAQRLRFLESEINSEHLSQPTLTEMQLLNKVTFPFGNHQVVSQFGPLLIDILLNIIENTIDRLRNLSSESTKRLTLLNIHTGKVESLSIQSLPNCLNCQTVLESTLPLFSEKPILLPTNHQNQYRTRRLDFDVLNDCISPLSIVRKTQIDLQSPFGAVSHELPTTRPNGEPVIGRSLSFQEAKAISVLEGFERYCGLHPISEKQLVNASYKQLTRQSNTAKPVNPTDFGVHPLSSYNQAGFRFRHYSPDIKVGWVPAYSFQKCGPVLVPERCVFWGPRSDDSHSFFYETSNGSALGATLEEAAIHGIKELVERDAFLMTWYLGLDLPEIDLESIPLSSEHLRELYYLKRKSEQQTGFRIRAFLSTMEYGVPSLFLTAENNSNFGPQQLFGASAGYNVVSALTGGIYELTGSILALSHRFDSQKEKARAMIDDSSLVRLMEDHSIMNSLPEARERVDFLLRRRESVMQLRDIEDLSISESLDLRVHLKQLTNRFLNAGMDVILADQTLPLVKERGFHCVKMIIPGLLPMTFGHENRRTEGLPRLRTNLTRYSSLMQDGELNPYPHPFP